MAENTPDVPPIPMAPLVDLTGNGGEPDDKTVVRPRKKAEPKPKADAPSTSEIGNRTSSGIAAPAAAVPPAVPVATPVEAAPVAPEAQPNPYATPAAAQPNPYAAAPAAPVNPYASAPAAPASPYSTPQPYANGPYVPQPPKGLSLTSMILGIVGLLFSFAGAGFLIVVGAIVTGHMAAKRQPYAKSYWVTGLITGYIGLAFSLIYGLIWAIFIFGAFVSSNS